MGNQTQIIILGAGYAGLLAAIRLAGKTRRHNTAITLVNASDHFIERMRLHEFAANRALKSRPITHMLRGTGVQFVQGIVTGIDPVAKTVAVQMGGETRQTAYDKLLYALGSTTDRDSVPGVSEFAYTLTPTGERSAVTLRNLLPTLPDGTRLVICGGGATGIEAAAEFADTYPKLNIRLITRGDLGGFLGDDVAAYMRKSLEARRVLVQDRTIISRIGPKTISPTGGDSIPYDVCLWTGGFRVSSLAGNSGLSVNERGQILIDPYMRSVSHPDIYAVGDAAYPLEEPGVHVRMSAFTALIMGAHGADTLAAAVCGEQPKPFSFIYVGQGIALGHNNAIGFGKEPNDVPKAPYFTGRVGYRIRETLVTVLGGGIFELERRIPGAFWWPGKNRYAHMKHTTPQSSKQPKATM